MAPVPLPDEVTKRVEVYANALAGTGATPPDA